MELREEPFRLVSGDGTPRYYPAHIAIKDRHEPGLRFELMAGRPWRWNGAGVPAEVRLVDVLAAAALESLAGREVPRAPILAAHELVLVAALRGLAGLAERLVREQAAVLDTVDEWQLAGWPGRRCAIGRSATTSSTPPGGSRRRSRWSATTRRAGCGRAPRPPTGWGPGPASPGAAG